MTDTSEQATKQMAEQLADLDGAEPQADASDAEYKAQVDRLIATWRTWIDEMIVQLDLGRMDVRDEAGAVAHRLENAWLSLKNEAERLGADADTSATDLRRDVGTLLGDLRRAAGTAVDRLWASR